MSDSSVGVLPKKKNTLKPCESPIDAMSSPVWFFIPNLIGYARILFAIAAFYVAYSDYRLFFAFYMTSQLLDAADGHAARMFNQCSKFGAVLDQVTDRASTASLLVILARLYPDYTELFVAVNALDLVSHYAHLYSTLVKNPDESHKTIDIKKQGFILYYYYSSKAVLFTMCLGNEAFFLLAYASHFSEGFEVFVPFLGEMMGVVKLFLYISFPICCMKQFINVVQLWHAMCDIVEIDERARLGKEG